jgi:hypothetical protein
MSKRFTPLKVSAPVRSGPVLSTEEIRRDKKNSRVGLSPAVDSPTLTAFTRRLFQLLDSGVASCSDTRNGRPWPRPRIEGIRSLVEQYPEDLCLAAAREAREIVQSHDRAPNVTNLFAKKLADLQAERESVRSTIREALA